MNYLELSFVIRDEAQNEVLLALLSNAGYEGFEEDAGVLKAFIKQEAFNADELAEIMQRVPVNYRERIIEEENWNARWESGFEPVRVNDFAGIRAGFHPPLTGIAYEIIITPKMSFGTGHHATTYLMIAAMEHLNLNNKTVLDFGTGTGVLAILAEKKGARLIHAVDNDEWSILNARENIANNNCTKTEVIKNDTIEPEHKYEIIFANINLNVILSNMQVLHTVSNKDTRLYLSGFFESDLEAIKTSLNANDFTFLGSTSKSGWCCVEATLNPKL